MKTLCTFLLFFCLNISFSQADSVKHRRQIAVKCEAIEGKINPTNQRCQKGIYGEFIIDSYITLADNALNAHALELLVGSIVKIAPLAITGAEIDPMSMEVYESEVMTSEDYIYREFGVGLQKRISSLPYNVHVHKTDHVDCYGILELGGNKVALPYKGVLLFLIRR